MTTHKTIEDARKAVVAGVVSIIEIDHAAAGRCYICCRGTMAQFAAAIKARPMPEIVALVSEHPVKVAVTDRPCRCERCQSEVNRSTAYSQQEWSRIGGSRIQVTAYYCESCRQLLSAIGTGEQSDLRHRSASVPSYEPESKQD